jgi:hypothetical protein
MYVPLSAAFEEWMFPAPPLPELFCSSLSVLAISPVTTATNQDIATPRFLARGRRQLLFEAHRHLACDSR